MSRSYKKNPGYTDGEPSRKRFFKRLSNKKTRKNWNLSNKGNAYKKNGVSYNIVDYKHIYHKESDYEYYNHKTGEFSTIPKNERYKSRGK